MSSKNYSSPLPPRALLPALRVMAVRGLFPLGDRLFGQHISERLEFLRTRELLGDDKKPAVELSATCQNHAEDQRPQCGGLL